MLANRQPDRCGSQIGATKSVRPSRCQAPGAKQIHRSLGLRPEPVDARKRQPDRCGSQIGATKSVRPSRCQAPGASPGQMLANRRPNRCQGRSNQCQAAGTAPGRLLANRRPNRCQAPSAEPSRMLANRPLKSVPGTRCGAKSDASKQAAQIGARHQVRSQVGC